MRRRIIIISVIVICICAIWLKIKYESNITLEMNQRVFLLAMCEQAGYDITRDNMTLERDGYFSSFRTWRWHIVFDDEPNLDYVFMEYEGGGICLVEIIGEGIPQKDFATATDYFEGTCCQGN